MYETPNNGNVIQLDQITPVTPPFTIQTLVTSEQLFTPFSQNINKVNQENLSIILENLLLQASSDFCDPTCQTSQTAIENLSHSVTNSNILNEQSYNKDKNHKKILNHMPGKDVNFQLQKRL